MFGVIASIIDGVLVGLAYGLAAMGLTLIWGVMDVINVTHGTMIVAGMMALYLISGALGISPYLSELGITTLADRLRSSFPDLMLRITTGWPEQLLEQLRRSEIDVAAFCLPDGVSPPTEIEADALDIQPLFVAASRSRVSDK